MILAVERTWHPGFNHTHDELKILNFWAAAHNCGEWSVVRLDNDDLIGGGFVADRIDPLSAAKAKCESVIRDHHARTEKNR